MGGGTMVINIVQYVEKINLEGLMPMYGQIGNQIIAQTAARKWMRKYNDEAHQDIAFYNSFCEDFHCFRIKEK